MLMLRWSFWPFGRSGEVDCAEVAKRASDYIEQDQDLPEETREKIQRHLSWCGPCNAFVRTLQATIQSLRSMPRQNAPDKLKEQLHRLPDQEK